MNGPCSSRPDRRDCQIWDCFSSSVSIATVLLSRTLWLRLMHSRPFIEQVLVLGKTPLARAVIAELQARPNYQILEGLPAKWNGKSSTARS